MEEYRIQLPEVRRHVNYLLNLFPSELHIFVRPEIQSLQDPSRLTLVREQIAGNPTAAIEVDDRL